MRWTPSRRCVSSMGWRRFRTISSRVARRCGRSTSWRAFGRSARTSSRRARRWRRRRSMVWCSTKGGASVAPRAQVFRGNSSFPRNTTTKDERRRTNLPRAGRPRPQEMIPRAKQRLAETARPTRFAGLRRGRSRGRTGFRSCRCRGRCGSSAQRRSRTARALKTSRCRRAWCGWRAGRSRTAPTRRGWRCRRRCGRSATARSRTIRCCRASRCRTA